jgi:hypothetical protein
MNQNAPAETGWDRENSQEWLSEIASLRGAVRQHVHSPDRKDDRLLRAVLTPIARRSRGDGIDAARLVVRFKQTWLGLPEVDMLSRHESQSLLDRAVTVLIEEYYATA